jgi:hypothetical protein
MQWISSRAASPAPIFPSPERAPESTVNTPVCGGNSLGLFAKFGRDGSLLKTSHQFSLWAQDRPFSENLTDSGSMRNGSLYERAAWEPRINESESSFSADFGAQGWPTPQAADSQQAGTALRETLDFRATTWPTPRGEDAESAGNHPNGESDSLTGATRLWNTPLSSNANGASKYDGKRGIGLHSQAGLWQTPATDSFRSRGGDRKDDATSTEGANLKRQAENEWNCSHPVQEAESGPESSPSSPGSVPRLNPAFVCWLMGWPFLWTHPEPISFGQQETESYLFRARRLLSSFFEGSAI